MEGRGKKLVQLVLLNKESHDQGEVRDIEPILSIAPRSPSILKSHDGDLMKHSLTNAVETSNIRDDKTQPIRISDDENSSRHAFSGTEEEQYVPKPSSSSNISINAVESSSIHNDQTQPIRDSYSENSSEQDFSGTDDDEQYVPNPSTNSHSSSSSSSSSSNSSESSSSSESDHETLTTGNINQESGPSTIKRSRKRTRNPSKWKKNVAKMLKNSGQQYTSLKTGMVKAAKIMGPTCSDKCRLSCSSKFSTEKRTKLFEAYWQLGQLQRQRDYLASCVRLLELSYRRIKESRKNNPRKPNTTFYLCNDGREVRVCKTFFLNTLGATERILRTVIECKYKDEGHNIMKEDGRGRHGKQIRLDEEIKQSVRDHINSIPKIESHYLRANTSRLFVEGDLTIAEMHRHYKKKREDENKPQACYDAYARIFNTEFNIGFFIPKKDTCDDCEAYKNASIEEKAKLENSYKLHLEEKSLSRIEKDVDMRKCKSEGNTFVIIYDLQAVMPCPIGKSSAFFYKSKLNCYNFTMSDAKNQETTCFFWHEGIGNRGAIEIGSCIYNFLRDLAEKSPGCDVIFYSDNCCGQQKNKFIFCMYYYAVNKLQINSVTH